jgi:hypothetical protein
MRFVSPLLKHESELAFESVCACPGEITAEILGESLFGDDVHMGWVLKGFWTGIGWGHRVKDAIRLQYSVNLAEEIDKWSLALGIKINEARYVLNKVKRRHIVKEGVWIRNWSCG